MRAPATDDLHAERPSWPRIPGSCRYGLPDGKLPSFRRWLQFVSLDGLVSGAVSAAVLLQVELPAWAYHPPPLLPEVQARAAPSSPARPQIPVPGAPDFPANTSRRRSTSRYRAPE